MHSNNSKLKEDALTTKCDAYVFNHAYIQHPAELFPFIYLTLSVAGHAY